MTKDRSLSSEINTSLAQGEFCDLEIFLSPCRAHFTCRCVGMQLGRHRFFYDEGRNLPIWHAVLGASTFVVIVLSFVEFGKWAPWLKNRWLHV